MVILHTEICKKIDKIKKQIFQINLEYFSIL